jgi:hypothetical protein
MNDDVLTLAASDVDNWKSVPLRDKLVAVVVPGECRERFYESRAWAALAPCLSNGVIVFLGSDRRVDVCPATLRWPTLEVSGDKALYLHLVPPQSLTPAVRTVEAVAGRVFADLDADGRLLGVEVLN